MCVCVFLLLLLCFVTLDQTEMVGASGLNLCGVRCVDW